MKLIVITGIDGAGKTTLQEDLLRALTREKSTRLHLPHSGFVHGALQTSGNNQPFADPWTDRLIFALDNRLVGYELVKMTDEYSCLIAQRGWMDSFIGGAVQGYNYECIADLTRVEELPKPYCTIYLNCDAEVAYERIVADPHRDKFETLEYMKKQFHETRNFYNSLSTNPMLSKLFPEKTFYIDTTELTQAETFKEASGFLEKLGFYIDIE